MDFDEWARKIVAPWEHGSDEHRQWLRDMAVPAVAEALKEARLQALVDVRRELIPISEKEIDPGLVETVEAREDVSAHDTIQLGWFACFTAFNGMTLRLLAESKAPARPS